MTNPAAILDKPETVKPEENAVWPAGAETESGNTRKLHIVKEGETLGDIAEKYYGNRLMINRIVDSNPDTISDSNKIIAGMKLFIEN